MHISGDKVGAIDNVTEYVLAVPIFICPIWCNIGVTANEPLCFTPSMVKPLHRQLFTDELKNQ
jgi:hypothetical protein